MWPNFLVVGASKAGTTSVYHALRQHPDIFLSKVKEPHYFSFSEGLPEAAGPDDSRFRRRVVTDPQAYTNLFSGAGDAPARGECSVSYLFLPQAAPAIRRAIPDCRILILLRNPVDRAWSQYRQNVMNGREPLPFDEALAAEAGRLADGWRWIFAYRQAGLYSGQVERYLKLFGQSQVRCYLFDDLETAPLELLGNMYRFLGADPGFRPKIAVYNRSALPKRLWLNRILVSPPAAAVARRLLPARLRHRIRELIMPFVYDESAQGDLPPEDRATLQRQFAGDIISLQTILGRELSAWLDS